MLQHFWQWILDPAQRRGEFVVCGAFVAGLILGRMGRRRQRRRVQLDREGDEAFFKGIQSMPSNEHDQTIEAFPKFVQVDSETIATYTALGNFYCSKGDIDRTIRIRQSIILRPNLDETTQAPAFNPGSAPPPAPSEERT